MSVDWGKVVIATVAMIVGIVLIITGDTTAGVGLVTLVVGYTLGNGKTAVRNEQPQPMIGRKNPPQQEL